MKEVVGKNIKYYRQKANLTQFELSKLIGVTPSAVGNWEQELHCPSSKNLYKLCHVFKISSDKLVFENKKTHVNLWTKFLKFSKK